MTTDVWQPPTPGEGTPEDYDYWIRSEEFARYWQDPPEPPETREEALRRRATAFLGPLLLLPLLGAPAALLWRAVTPKVGINQTPSGPQPTAGESDQFFAIEGWYVVVTVAVGLALGALAWRLLRGRGPLGPAGVALGGLLAAAVTATVGSRLVVDSYMFAYCNQPDLECTVYDGTLTLRANIEILDRVSVPAPVVFWPMAMLVMIGVLTLVFEREW